MTDHCIYIFLDTFTFGNDITEPQKYLYKNIFPCEILRCYNKYLMVLRINTGENKTTKQISVVGVKKVIFNGKSVIK